MSTPPYADIAAWPPTRHTPPLSDDFASAFDRYARVFAVVWVSAFGYALEAWQIHLIRAILEVFPEGHPRAGQLRWQQVVISLGRQNGKTEIAAAIALWRLLSKRHALVIGIASSAEQANLVYKRAMRAIGGNPELGELFDTLTETRGIRTLEGGEYQIKAAKSAALQGLPIDLGLVDELHLLKRALWGDLVSGTGARPDCLVFGITTAGDDESELLLDLYDLGEKAIATDGASRVGFWAWEAPEARVPEDDDTLGRWLAMANPAVASGRTDLAALIAIVRTKHPSDVVRYHLNRFLAGARAPFVAPDLWHSRARVEGEFPAGRPVFAFDAAPGLSYVSVTATVRDEQGVTHSELVASLVNPSFDRLLAIAQALCAHSPLVLAFEGYTLRKLGRAVEAYGWPVSITSLADTLNAAAVLYRLIAAGQFAHGGEPLLAQQAATAARKASGDEFKIVPGKGAQADAMIATAIGAYVLETTPQAGGAFY